MTASLHLNLLGTPELLRDGAPLTNLHSQKAVALLAYLACNPGPQRREFLADLLWDATSTAQSLSNLRTLLSRLRRQMDDVLVITPQSLALAAAPQVRVDVASLERQAGTAGRLSSQSAADLARALAGYRGDFLAGFDLSTAWGFEEWATVERERLRFAALQGFRRLTDYFLEQEDLDAGMGAAGAWLRLDGLDEEAHGQMMRLLARSGQRSAALAHYESCCKILRAELDVDAGEALQALHRQISAEPGTASPPPRPQAPAAPARHNLPQRPIPFVGREGELAALGSLLTAPATRLVTLAGEGGVGKSTLAVTVGWALLDAWADGVRYASLLEIEAEPAATLSHRLAATLAAAVGLTFATAQGGGDPATQLFNFLRERCLLLILDHFEHLSPGAVFVAELLEAAPGCRTLVISRQPLRLQAETVVRLEGLPAPAAAAPLALADESYASVALFARRAKQRQHSFAITPANREALGRLCRLVAGNALALELAAAWVEHFSLPEMVARLETNILDFLRSPQRDAAIRHSSLRQVMQTSWQLLAPDARRMLAQLSLFRGSFHRDAVLAVTDGSLDLLVDLVNGSLVQQREPGRYELHEVVRQFAGEQLDAATTAGDASAQRHAAFYLALVGRVERTSAQIAQVSEELANVRQAWAWAVENADVAGLAGASVGLWNFYLRKGLFQEAEEAFGRGIDALLAIPPETEGRRRALAALRVAQAVFLNLRSRYAEAMAVAEEAVGYALQEEDEALIARGYLQWGTAHYRQGRYAEAAKRLRMALLAAQDAGLPGDQADVLRHLGVTLLEQGDFDAAHAHCEEALVLYRRTGNRLGEGNSLTDLGWINQRQQNFEEARFYFEAAQRIHTAIDNGHGARMVMINLGIVYQMLGEFGPAYQIYQQLFGDLDAVPDPYHHSQVNHSLGVLLTRMGAYPSARRHLLAAVEIDHAIGDQGGLAWTYNALGMLHNHLGDAKIALAYHHQALGIGREQGAATVEGIALLGLGQDYQELGQWEKARAAYVQAIEVQAKLKQLVRVMESRGGLARTLLALNQSEAALEQVALVLEHLGTRSLQGAAQPALVYWNCYAVLHALGDPRAAALLADARDLVQSRAARMDDDRLQQIFLHGAPAHREIFQA